MTPGEPGTPPRTRRRFRITRGRRLALFAVVLILLAVVLLRATWRDVYAVSGPSMSPTLTSGQRVLVDRTVGPEDLHRGDIIVFDGRGSLAPYQESSAADTLLRTLHLRGGDDTYVKRIIGLPGDRVACCSSTGAVTVNGTVLDEPYLDGEAPSLTRFDSVVPAGGMWVMGDHRSVSADSRSLLGSPGGGIVSEDRVIGRVTRVVWPLDAQHPVDTSGEK